MASSKKVKYSEFKMPESADIVYVEDFMREAKKLIKSRKKKVVIDCSQIERITTPCVQLFLSMAETLATAERSMVIKKPSSAMEEAFSDLGFADKLAEWSV